MRHSTYRSRALSGVALFALSLTISTLIIAGRAQAAAAYWRCGLDRVTVISNGSAVRCEILLRETIRYEQVLAELVGWEPDASILPLNLYSLTRGDAKQVMFTAGQLAEQTRTRTVTYSKYLPGLDLNIASIVDVGGDEPMQSLLFIYGQSLLANGPVRSYPAWYQLGVANLLNGLVIRPDGTVLLNRNQTFVAVVEGSQRAGGRLNLAALLDAKIRDLPAADFNELARRAHVWAQFGLLTTAEHRKQYRELALLMRQGAPAEEAVPAAFGISLAVMTEQFDAGAWRKDASYRLPAPSTSPSVTAAAPIDAPAAEALFKLIEARVAEKADAQ
jgi:hypothetical protein